MNTAPASPVEAWLKRRLDRFINNKVTDLVVALLIMLSILLLLMGFSEAFDPQVSILFEQAGELLTILFIIELTIRFYVAANKRLFFRRYWLDILAVIPWARSLRVFRVLRLLRIFRAGTLLARSLETFRAVFVEGRGEALVILVTIFILVVITGLGIHLIEPVQEDFDEVGESIWWSLLSLIAGEPIGGFPQSLFGKILTVVVMLGGLTVFAMFTGLVSAVMVKRLRSEAEVKAMEISEMENHILLCGWNRLALLLFDELAGDPELAQRPIVVIGEFEDLDVLKLAGAHRDRIYPLNGDPTRVDVLEQAGAHRASYAILLADRLTKRSDQDRDARTILTALTLEKMKPDIYTVAELLSREGTEHLRMAGVEEVIIGDEIASSLIATSIRSRGVMPMVEELFTARYGCRFFKVPTPKAFVNRPFAEVAAAMKTQYEALVVGVDRSQEHGSRVITNPPADEILQESDRLVLIAKKPPDIPA